MHGQTVDLSTSPYAQNFDSLASTGTSSITPSGWKFYKSNSGTSYAAGTGSDNAGNTYSFGAASASERAFGALSSGSVKNTIGSRIRNNSGSALTEITISYTGEMWRLGDATGRKDSLLFALSTDATSLNSGTWTKYPDLHFVTPNTTAPTGSKDGNNTSNRTLKSSTITGLNIAAGDIFWIRWVDPDISGSDDGLGIDDFSLSFAPPSGNSTSSNIIYNSSFGVSSNVDYLNYIANDVTATNSLELGQFILQDGGGAADADALPTTLTGLTMVLTNFANLDRIALYDGTTELAEIPAAAAATFTGLSLIAPDDGSKTFSVRATFKSTVTDNQQISAQITSATADNAGSGFAAGDAGGAQTSISGDDNRIEVTATQLTYVQNVTSPTAVNADMTPAVTLSADDANGNRDLDFTATVSIISTGTLVGSPVIANAVAGLATFATIKHSAVGTGLQLTAISGAWTELSNLFDIALTSSATDYFRSKTTGDWEAAASWESSVDGLSWQDATQTPTAASAGIQVRSGHTITKNAGQVDADQMVIEAGGKLILDDGTFYLLGAVSGDDLVVDGTLEMIDCNFSPDMSATVLVSATGVYQHNRNAGTVITATWDVNSTCEITGMTTATTISGLGQAFGNFTWNSLLQNTTVNLLSGLTTVNGNFWNKNTNGNVLRLGNVPYTLTVMGNFTNDAPLELGKESYDLCIIKIKGNLSSTALFSTQDPTNVGKVVMNGTGQQTINVPAGFTDKVALEIDNSFAGVGVSLTDNFNSTDKLILTNGKLSLGNFNFSVLSAITGGTATNYVVTDGTGRLIRTLISEGPHKFPIGSTTSYQPAELTFVSAPTSNTIAAGFISADPGYSGLPLMETDAIDQIGRTGYWELNSTITQNYTAVFTANNFPDVIDYTRLHLLKRSTGGNWFLDGAHIEATGSNASATVSRSGMSGFSQFAIGGENGVVLPVRFISFTGKTLPIGNQLNWMVADEVNNKGFEIERSTSAGDFRTIGFVASQTDISIRTNSYHYTDVTAAAQGNFYRLKQIDVNGGYAYSNIIFLKDVDSKIVVYPTLVTDMLTVSGAISGDQGVIYDAQGMQVERFEISGSETKVDLSRLPSGTYIIHINGSRSESFRVNKY